MQRHNYPLLKKLHWGILFHNSGQLKDTPKFFEHKRGMSQQQSLQIMLVKSQQGYQWSGENVLPAASVSVHLYAL